jgi:uncharacterized Zn finger protein (UPF0148 family)
MSEAMLDFMCSTCGKRSQADAGPIMCPDCNRTVTVVTVIADPETAAKAKKSRRRLPLLPFPALV